MLYLDILLRAAKKVYLSFFKSANSKNSQFKTVHTNCTLKHCA